jgi:hypothetical protein
MHNKIEKKYFMIQLIVMLAAFLASIDVAYCYDFKYDDFYCTIISNEDKTVSVSAYSSTSYSNSNNTFTELTIPQSVSNNGTIYTVTDVGSFRNSEELTSVSIPSSVTSIGDGAFSGCDGLKKVNISDISAWCNISFDGESANPLVYAQHLYLNDEEIKDLVIPENVAEIKDYAFSGCAELTSVTIPPSVTSIGESAFSGCDKLEKVNISDMSAWYNTSFDGVYANPLRCAHHLYLNGEEVKDLVIPKNIIAIPGWAFQGCSEISSVSIPSTVFFIGGGAFADCTGLTSVNIPLSVASIEYETFYGCTGLTSVSIPSSVTSICDEAFKGCTGLTSVSIPSSVTSIGEGAFAFCTGLTEVSIPSSVTSIGGYAFYCCNLSSVAIPPSVTSIGYYTFAYCSGLRSVSISPSVTHIGYNAFDCCTYLEKIDISDMSAWCNISFDFDYDNRWNNPHHLYLNGEEVKDLVIPEDIAAIKGYAFYCCGGLTSVSIPSSVTSIGKYAFEWCTGLTSVSIPSSVTSIGSYAFWGCTGLTSVTCMWDEPITTTKGVFSDETYNCPLYVPVGTREKYQTTEPWSHFGTIIEKEMSGIDDINLSQETEVSVVDGAICVSGDEPVRIVAMNGATVYNGRGNCSVNVAKGIYIVIVGGKSQKVAVK